MEFCHTEVISLDVDEVFNHICGYSFYCFNALTLIISHQTKVVIEISISKPHAENVEEKMGIDFVIFM